MLCKALALFRLTEFEQVLFLWLLQVLVLKSQRESFDQTIIYLALTNGNINKMELFDKTRIYQAIAGVILLKYFSS